MATSTTSVSAESARHFVIDLLSRHGVPADRAQLMADGLVLADLRGVDTHGINRLAGCLDRIKYNVLNPAPDLQFEMRTPVMAFLDAKNTFGFIVGCMAIDKGVEMATTFGVGIVSVKHSNHYGMAATYLVRAIKKVLRLLHSRTPQKPCRPGEGRSLFLVPVHSLWDSQADRKGISSWICRPLWLRR